MGAFAGPAEWWTDSTSDGVNHIATKGIVQSGLVVNLDAGTLASYPGSGSTWTNLAPSATNNGNATLKTAAGLNGYAGITTSEGYFSQPRAYIPNPGGGAFATFTYSVWCYPTVLSGYQSIIDQDNDDFLFCFAGSGSLMIYDPNYTIPGFTASTNKWYNLVVTHTQGSPFTFYIDGVSVHTTANDSTSHTFDNWSFGAGSVTSGSDGNEKFDGYMSSILIYNRALTAAEVTQNYNATKGRYGY
tara:strand:- start:43 stop:774 length:732 start_codon:yes stop_codon:yes gene_type:complete